MRLVKVSDIITSEKIDKWLENKGKVVILSDYSSLLIKFLKQEIEVLYNDNFSVVILFEYLISSSKEKDSFVHSVKETKFFKDNFEKEPNLAEYFENELRKDVLTYIYTDFLGKGLYGIMDFGPELDKKEKFNKNIHELFNIKGDVIEINHKLQSIVSYIINDDKCEYTEGANEYLKIIKAFYDGNYGLDSYTGKLYSALSDLYDGLSKRIKTLNFDKVDSSVNELVKAREDNEKEKVMKDKFYGYKTERKIDLRNCHKYVIMTYVDDNDGDNFYHKFGELYLNAIQKETLERIFDNFEGDGILRQKRKAIEELLKQYPMEGVYQDDVSVINTNFEKFQIKYAQIIGVDVEDIKTLITIINNNFRDENRLWDGTTVNDETGCLTNNYEITLGNYLLVNFGENPVLHDDNKPHTLDRYYFFIDKTNE